MVDDDKFFCEVLASALQSEGYEVVIENAGWRVDRTLLSDVPDVALIDLRLIEGPGGLSLTRRVAAGGVPVIVCSASDNLEDVLAAFDAGADDFLSKPFALAELFARLRAALRRVRGRRDAVVDVGGLTLNERAHTVHYHGVPIETTPLQFALLHVLCRHRDIVLSKSQLLADVWGYDSYDANVVEVHVSALRRKLETVGPRLIHTVRGVGYMLREPDVPQGQRQRGNDRRRSGHDRRRVERPVEGSDGAGTPAWHHDLKRSRWPSTAPVGGLAAAPGPPPAAAS